MENEGVDSKSDDSAENKDSKKKDTIPFRYEREDLVWEAVRRNEEYKQFYLESKNEYPEDKNENKSFIKNHTNRWQICEEEVLNPNITAKELRQKIINGASPVAVHPYALRFRVCGHSTIVPEDWERIIVKQTKDGMYKIEEEVLDVIFKIINQSKLFIPVWGSTTVRVMRGHLVVNYL